MRLDFTVSSLAAIQLLPPQSYTAIDLEKYCLDYVAIPQAEGRRTGLLPEAVSRVSERLGSSSHHPAYLCGHMPAALWSEVNICQRRQHEVITISIQSDEVRSCRQSITQVAIAIRDQTTTHAAADSTHDR